MCTCHRKKRKSYETLNVHAGHTGGSVPGAGKGSSTSVGLGGSSTVCSVSGPKARGGPSARGGPGTQGPQGHVVVQPGLDVVVVVVSSGSQM
jgi:hypothetical protein